MASEAQQEWYFTAPSERVYVRRGDALGLRGLADQLGELVAPGLTTRTGDARWIAILSWCLVHSHEVWHRFGGSSLRSRAEAAGRYAWLRPLELMWVARTLALANENPPARQLPGQRRVGVWRRDGQSAERFAMSDQQYRVYRQTGVYGAYRTLFRSLPGLTLAHSDGLKGDGWTPGELGHSLARSVEKMLGGARLKSVETSDRKLSAVWGGREDEWWLKTWSSFDTGSGRSLPTRLDDFEELEESALHREVLFSRTSTGARRAHVARLMSKSRAVDHAELCDQLAASLRGEPDGAQVGLLPFFTRLADAGLAAMDSISTELAANERGPGIALSELVSRPGVARSCDAMVEPARVWLDKPRESLRHLDSAYVFARAVASGSLRERVQNLIAHHAHQGGGVRWFALQGDVVQPWLRPSERASSRYRFGLWQLARMAMQAGEVRSMPAALRDDLAYAREDLDE